MTTGRENAVGTPGETRHSVAVNGTRLFYRRYGEGEPVVLVHGFCSTSYSWRRVAPTLAERYTVIAPDLRGQGDSAPVLGGFDKTTLAQDIHGLIETLDLGPVHLVGFDWGAVIAYFCAARHQEEVRSLTLLEGLVPGFGFEQGLDMRDSTATWFIAFHAQPDLPEALVTGRERLYLQSLFQSFLYDPTVVSDADLDEYARAHARPGTLRAAFGMYRTIAEDIIAARALARCPLTMPVLALGGAECFGATVADAARPLAPHLQGGVIEEAAHFLAEERPEEVARRLLDFFLAAESTSDGLV